MNIKLYILFIVTSLASLVSYGQDYNKYCLYSNYAEKAYEQNDFENAIILMDTAIAKCPEMSNNEINWFNLSLFYKSLYKKTKDLTLRDKILSSALKSKELDTNNEFTKPINKTIKSVASYYQADARIILNDTSKSPYLAVIKHTKYKEIYKLAYPGKEFIKEDINIYNIIGHVFNIKYMNNTIQNSNYTDSSVFYYKKSLKLDSNQANIYREVGIIYFNEAVNLINNLDPESDIETLMNTDIKKAELALKSIPYFEKVLEMSPSNSEVIYSLAGCYELISSQEKHEYYLKLLKEKDPEYYKTVITYPTN